MIPDPTKTPRQHLLDAAEQYGAMAKSLRAEAAECEAAMQKTRASAKEMEDAAGELLKAADALRK